MKLDSSNRIFFFVTPGERFGAQELFSGGPLIVFQPLRRRPLLARGLKCAKRKDQFVAMPDNATTSDVMLDVLKNQQFLNELRNRYLFFLQKMVKIITNSLYISFKMICRH